jgi:hypothetical protein
MPEMIMPVIALWTFVATMSRVYSKTKSLINNFVSFKQEGKEIFLVLDL